MVRSRMEPEGPSLANVPILPAAKVCSMPVSLWLLPRKVAFHWLPLTGVKSLPEKSMSAISFTYRPAMSMRLVLTCVASTFQSSTEASW